VSRRGSHLEIVADILTEALNGVNKTRLVYRANLNFLRSHTYLSQLLDKGLLVEENTSDGRFGYRTTDAGKRLLNIMRGARSLMEEAEQLISA